MRNLVNKVVFYSTQIITISNTQEGIDATVAGLGAPGASAMVAQADYVYLAQLVTTGSPYLVSLCKAIRSEGQRPVIVSISDDDALATEIDKPWEKSILAVLVLLHAKSVPSYIGIGFELDKSGKDALLDILRLVGTPDDSDEDDETSASVLDEIDSFLSTLADK